MIQTLGLGAIPWARQRQAGMPPALLDDVSRQVRPDMKEYGATGTPIFGGGFLRDLGEYNSEFQGGPFAAFRLYEKMRRGDAQVAATLTATKLPIRCAEWGVMPPKDPTPAEREAAEFIEKALFDEMDFNGVVENALLMLDFGVAAHEDVWEVVNGKIQWKKMAARLPLTFYEWITEQSSEDLTALVQMGYKGQQWIRTLIPMEKLAVFTFRQEGANFAGRALLREMYQHWFIKNKLYIVDSIACERNGMGVPTVTMGPDGKVEDRLAAAEWVKTLSAGDATGLVLPPSWLFELQGLKGGTRDPKDSIAHHNSMISMAGLAMFMLLGQSHGGSGSKGLGDSMSDFFYMGVQGTANQVGTRISKSSIARLCAMNFGTTVRPPLLVPQQILAVKFEAMTTALANLGHGGVITPTPELEAWLRKKMGAPETDAATIARMRAKLTTSGAPAAQPGQPGAQPGGQPGAAAPGQPGGAIVAPVKDGDDPNEEDDPIEPIEAAEFVGPTQNGLKLRREPRGVERHLALHDISSTLDQGRADVADSLRRARPRIQAEVVHKLMNAKVRNMHRVSVPADAHLVGEVEGHLRGVSAFGREQVGKERASQRKGRGPGDAATIRMADDRGKIGLYADGVVSKFTNALTAKATSAASTARIKQGDKTTGQVINDVGAALDSQSDKWIDSLAGEGANQAFADGRQQGYEDYKDEIGSVLYSALLDPNTCGPCGDADGQEGPTPEDVPDVPNPDCEGGDKCRCVQVFVFADEDRSGK